ncbi:MAG TPA: glycosyltransferase family 4 protein [Opitutaceae bacterium]|nr:glycosyltransferase family 4 protein [Opitutaceae bacterium]
MHSDRPIRVAFCWTNISGYMAACWRALAARGEVDLRVMAYRAGGSSNSGFSEEIMTGIRCRLLDAQERLDPTLIEDWVVAQEPDVVVTTGWWQKNLRRLATAPRLRGRAFITGLDTPWRTPLQYFNRIRVGGYMRRLDRVVVAGERAWQHARNLGVPEHRIGRGQYGVDWTGLGDAVAERSKAPWPGRFLFVGRYVREKGIDVLLDGYASYRDSVDNPWPLDCCGMGPLSAQLRGAAGVTDLGFVQPSEMRTQWQVAGAFVIPSRFDPWPLALVEAAASGLPIIASEACGSSVEVLRHDYNGLRVPTGDPHALAAAMISLHRRHGDLPLWGQRSRELAAPYSAEAWTEKWMGHIRTALEERAGRTR